jgi:hypothetical protein
VIVPPFTSDERGERRLIRRQLDRAEAVWRYRTASARALPDYVIIGAPRSGTSYLARRVRWHPDVVGNFTAYEVHYFDRYHHLGPRWYQMHFPRRATLERLSRERGRRVICGEKTPNYLALPWVADELHAMQPDVRLVALLREPLDRAWSHYRMRERRGAQQPPFEAQLLVEAAERAAAGDDLDDLPPPVVDGVPGWRFVHESDYARVLQPWIARFGDRLRVWKAEDLYTDPVRILAEVCGHLGIEPERAPPPVADTSGWASATPAPPELRERCGHVFDVPKAAVAALLGLTWP